VASTNLPMELKRATISPLVNWKGTSDHLSSLVTVDSGPIESPEKRIFIAVPIPTIYTHTITLENSWLLLTMLAVVFALLKTPFHFSIVSNQDKT
jgi:hypothetical protein